MLTLLPLSSFSLTSTLQSLLQTSFMPIPNPGNLAHPSKSRTYATSFSISPSASHSKSNDLFTHSSADEHLFSQRSYCELCCNKRGYTGIMAARRPSFFAECTKSSGIAGSNDTFIFSCFEEFPPSCTNFHVHQDCKSALFLYILTSIYCIWSSS